MNIDKQIEELLENERESFEHDYKYDVLRMQELLAEDDITMSLKRCAEAWDNYSNSMAAGWMCLPDDDEITLSILKNYL